MTFEKNWKQNKPINYIKVNQQKYVVKYENQQKELLDNMNKWPYKSTKLTINTNSSSPPATIRKKCEKV